MSEYCGDMCGRFVIGQKIEMYSEHFAVDLMKTDQLDLSFNVAPTDPVYSVAEYEGERMLGQMRWGLIPHYSKDRKTIHINARAETVAEKPAFRSSFVKRRCLIPADGFYEWQRNEDGSKQPHFISTDSPMAFAGIWTIWSDPETNEKLTTCSIITTTADPRIEDIHERMPVSLQPELWDDWLDKEQEDPATLMGILDANRPGDLHFREVSTMVNSVRNNDPKLLDEV